MADQLEKQAVVRVDGKKLTIDGTPTGRQIRNAARPEPPSQIILIQYVGRGTRSIGLEEEADLSGKGVETFRTFLGDRVFNATLNERGVEWGDACIAESDLREIGRIPDAHEIVLDGQTDRVIERGSTVTLDGKGAERFRSRPAEAVPVCVIVNGRRKKIPRPKITFEEVIVLAFGTAPAAQVFTMVYRGGPKGQEKGIMQPGQCVTVKEGMNFNVSATNQS